MCYACGTKIEGSEEGEEGEAFLVASPPKALADYVYIHRCDWTSVDPLTESLRIEEESLAELTAESIERLVPNYTARRVRRFLEGLRRDL